MDLLDLYCTIAIDASGFERGVEDATKSSKGLSDTFKASGAAAETLQNKIAVLAAQHAKAQAEVDRLTAAFNKSAAETGVDSKETQALAVQLKNAEKNVASIQSELDGLTNSTKQSGDEFERTGEKVFAFADKLKSGLATAAKVGAAALTAASAALTAVGKAAIENYASYEQLTGGVETLFGTSASTVMDYANNAYKTAGLSANEYMETVTGFSASLLQSLGGDTEEAVRIADMAITDMADNTSKMGSTMESVQNAYAGFAKQNFTMLDNLKLGYGGTKEEMERLLADAAALSGVEYDVSSYADIVQAIHVVQDEMGVTGTTALEASETISGSVAAAKSAWENLVAGIANQNADLGGLIANFVDSVATAGDNVIPRVQQILVGISGAVGQLAPMIGEVIPQIVTNVLPSLLDAAMQMIGALGQGLLDNVSVIVDAAAQVLMMLVNGIVTELPRLVEAATEVIITLADGIVESLPELIPTIVGVVLQIVETLIDNVDMLLDAAIEIIFALADGLIDSLPILLEKAPEIITKFVDALIRNVPKIITAANELIVEFAAGIINNIPTVINAATKIKDKIKETLANLPAMAREWGVDMLSSFIGGITSKLSNLRDTVKGVAQTVKDFIGFSEPKEGPLSNFHTFPLDMMDLFISGIASKESELVDELTTIGAIIADAFKQILAPLDLQSDISSLEYEIWEKQYDASNTALKEAAAELENAKALLESVKETYRDSEDEESAGLIAAAAETVSALQAQYDALKDQSEIEKYAKKQEMLTAQMENQTDVISAAEAAYQTILEQYGENSEESLRYQKTLLQEQLELENLRESLAGVAEMRSKLYHPNYDFGTTTVDFASSGVGIATVGLVNGMVSAASQSDAKSYTFNMVMPDGTKFASYVFDPMVDYARANGTPIVNPA